MRLLQHLIAVTSNNGEQSIEIPAAQTPGGTFYLAFVATSGGRNPMLVAGEGWEQIAGVASSTVHCWFGLYKSATGANARWEAGAKIASLAVCLQVFDAARVKNFAVELRSGVVAPPLLETGPAAHFYLQDWPGNTIYPPSWGPPEDLAPADMFDYKASNDTTVAHTFASAFPAGRWLLANAVGGNNLGGSFSVQLAEPEPAPNFDLKAVAAQLRSIADTLDPLPA